MVLEGWNSRRRGQKLSRRLVLAAEPDLWTHLLNDKGWVEVDDYFRVKEEHGKIFSIGDCYTLLWQRSGSC
jgi:NADPH-dependent 2,4-dienoyl-CoA reductase/sulfur reductase-like enzyme